MDLLEQEFSLFPLVWSRPSKIRAGNYCLISTVQILTVHCEIWSDAPDSEACLIWRSKMWPLLCVFLFLILSPDFTAVAAVVVVRGGGAGGDAVEAAREFDVAGSYFGASSRWVLILDHNFLRFHMQQFLCFLKIYWFGLCLFVSMCFVHVFWAFEASLNLRGRG